MSVQHEVLFVAYFDESIAIREWKRTTLLQVTMEELCATTTVVVNSSRSAVVVSEPLWFTLGHYDSHCAPLCCWRDVLPFQCLSTSDKYCTGPGRAIVLSDALP